MAEHESVDLDKLEHGLDCLEQLIIMAIIVYSRNQTEYFRADLIETQFMNRNLKAREIDSF